jgi:hypothetical protein
MIDSLGPNKAMTSFMDETLRKALSIVVFELILDLLLLHTSGYTRIATSPLAFSSFDADVESHFTIIQACTASSRLFTDTSMLLATLKSILSRYRTSLTFFGILFSLIHQSTTLIQTFATEI